MAKRARPQTTKDTLSDSFTTFSIRLNDQQRDLLLQAAALKGWTPTQLVRTASLERAIGICNTRSPRTFDYKGFAAKLVRRWFDEQAVEYSMTDSDWDQVNHPDGGGPLTVPVPALPLEDFFRFEKAVNEGGSEFLSLLKEFASGLVAPQRRDLPDPVDPRRVLGNED